MTVIRCNTVVEKKSSLARALFPWLSTSLDGIALIVRDDRVEEYSLPDGVMNVQSKRPPIYDEPSVRVVELNRVPESGLGISIVGGKVGPGGVGLKGIFIRHVLESSPAGRLGTLLTGDQILEVPYFYVKVLNRIFIEP